MANLTSVQLLKLARINFSPDKSLLKIDQFQYSYEIICYGFLSSNQKSLFYWVSALNKCGGILVK